MELWLEIWVILVITTTAIVTNPVHHEDCEEPEMRPHMHYTTGDDRHFPKNSVIYLSCSPDFFLTGPQTSICLSDELLWDPPLNSSFCEELEDTGNQDTAAGGGVEVFHGVTNKTAYHPPYLDYEKHNTESTGETNPDGQEIKKNGKETDYGGFKTESDFVDGKLVTLNDEPQTENESRSSSQMKDKEIVLKDEEESISEEDTEVLREEREENEGAVEDHQGQEEEREEDGRKILEEEQSVESDSRRIHPEGMPIKCHGPKPNSPCRASIPSYWFNYNTGECEFFIYGGCQGINVFPDETTCRETCQTDL